MGKRGTEEPVGADARVARRERVQRHREMLRASGLRPVTRWVPDTRSAEFAERYRQQRAIIADSITPDRKLEMEFWESTQAHEGWV